MFLRFNAKRRTFGLGRLLYTQKHITSKSLRDVQNLGHPVKESVFPPLNICLQPSY